MRALLAALVFWCLAPPPAAAATPPHRLTILFTNDVHGYVEPCG